MRRHLKVLGALVKQYTPRFLTHTPLLPYSLHLYTTYTTLRDIASTRTRSCYNIVVRETFVCFHMTVVHYVLSIMNKLNIIF